MSKSIKIIISDKERPNLHSLFHVWIDRKYKNYSPRYEYDEYLSELAAMGLYPYDEDDYDYDDGDVVFPINNKGNRGNCMGYGNDDYISDDDAYEMYWRQEAEKRKRREAREAKKRGGNILDADFVDFCSNGTRKPKHKHRSKGKKEKEVDIYTPYSGWEEEPDESGSDLDNREYFGDHVTIWYYPNYSVKDDRLEFNTLRDFDDFCCDEGIHVPSNIAEDIAYRPISHTCLNPYARTSGVRELFAAESYADMVYEVCNVDELGQ